MREDKKPFTNDKNKENSADGGGGTEAAAREAALRLLAYRDRTVQEMRDRLSRKGFAADIVESVLQRLLENGLLDDERFACSWIRNGQGSRPSGRRRLRYELRLKGVDGDLIETALAREYVEDEEEAVAAGIIAIRLARMDGMAPEIKYKRLASYLGRRGFSGGAIVRALKASPLGILDTVGKDELQ